MIDITVYNNTFLRWPTPSTRPQASFLLSFRLANKLQPSAIPKINNVAKVSNPAMRANKEVRELNDLPQHTCLDVKIASFSNDNGDGNENVT